MFASAQMYVHECTDIRLIREYRGCWLRYDHSAAARQPPPTPSALTFDYPPHARTLLMLQTGLPATRPARSGFEQYFEVVPARSAALRDEAYRLRHQVFCEDYGFEPRKPDRRESDHYDAQSMHLLIRSVRTGEFVGCTRIIRVQPRDGHPLLPFELICAGGIDRTIVDPAALPRHSIAEVSRLAILAKYRQPKGSRQRADTSPGNHETAARLRFPYILLGLYLATVELARLQDIETLFILTAPRLALHLRKVGVRIQTVGSPVEHHGTRIPSMLNISAVRAELRGFFRPLYGSIARTVGAGFTHAH